MFFLAKVGPEIYAVLFPLLCVFIPVVLLAIFVVVKKIVKNAKRASKMKANTGVDYEAYFGGHDNIVNIEIKMSRVSVTVKDVVLVIESKSNIPVYEYDSCFNFDDVKNNSEVQEILKEKNKLYAKQYNRLCLNIRNADLLLYL